MSLKDQIHVMVVDDMSTSRGLIIQALEAIGIANIRTAADGAEAVRELKAKPVHLVLSDYNMPEMDGLSLLQALRQEAATKKTGFILITGRADKEIVDRGKSLGMNNFIKKPFTPAELKSCLEAVTGRL